MDLLTVAVVQRTPQAEGICSFELADAAGRALPPYDAGAHIDVHVAPGLVRQYSLCGEPGTSRWRIGVLLEPASRGGSATLHGRLQAGDHLQVSAPRNLFPLVAAEHTLLIAGGIGITPMLAMAQALAAQGRSFSLHYACRSEAHVAFRQDLADPRLADKVHLHLGNGPAAQKLDLAALLAGQPPATHVYTCGPLRLMDAVFEHARLAGWPEDRLHRECFSAAPSARHDDGSFTLRLARSGREVHVSADRSALEALLAEGVDVPSSCETGVCGTCLTRVIEGEPDHRDSFLTPAERAANNQFTPCCSRSRSELLVIDL